MAIPPRFKNASPENISYPNGARGAPYPPLYTSSCRKFPTTETFNCEAIYVMFPACKVRFYFG